MNESIGCVKGGRVVRIHLHDGKEAGMLPENVIVRDPTKGVPNQIAGGGQHER